MGFIKQLNKDFFIENNQIILSKNYLLKNKWKFRKITGSRFASVIGKNKYNTSLKTWCIMVGIYQDDFDPFFAKIGNIIEPKITQYAREKLKTDFMVYDPKKIAWDIFASNKIFGGIPDGEPIDKDGIFDYKNNPMLEIKTTGIDSFKYNKVGNKFTLQKDKNNLPIIKQELGNYQKWFKNDKIIIPDEYIFQLSLYLYLRKVTKGIFFIAFLTMDNYINPSEFSVDDSRIEVCEIEIYPKLFECYIKNAAEWYEKHIIPGVSPFISSKDEEFLLEINDETSN